MEAPFPSITTQEAAMQGKVEICGVNTSRLHVLSQVEMDALLRRAQAGDEDARDKLIEGNLRGGYLEAAGHQREGEARSDAPRQRGGRCGA